MSTQANILLHAMNEKNEILTLWKPRKISKGDFFNMQSMVCNDLG